MICFVYFYNLIDEYILVHLVQNSLLLLTQTLTRVYCTFTRDSIIRIMSATVINLDEYDNQHNKIVNELKHLRNKEQTQNLKIIQLQNDIEKLNKSKKDLEETWDFSRSNNHKLNDENRRLLSDSHKLKRENRSQQNEINKLKSNNGKLVKKLRSSQEEIKALNDQTQRLKDTNKKLWSVKNKKKKELKDVQDKNKKLLQQIKDKQEQLQNYQIQYKKLKGIDEEKRKHILKLGGDINTKNAMIHGLLAQVQTLRNNINNTIPRPPANGRDSEYNHCYQSYQLARSNCDGLRTINNNLQSANVNLKQKLIASNQRYGKLKKRVDKMNKQTLENLERSEPILGNERLSRSKNVTIEKYLSLEKEKQDILVEADRNKLKYIDARKQFYVDTLEMEEEKERFEEEKERWKQERKYLMDKIKKLQNMNSNNDRVCGQKRNREDPNSDANDDHDGYEPQQKKFKREEVIG